MPTPFSDADLQSSIDFLSDGASMSYGGVSAGVLLDVADEELIAGEAASAVGRTFQVRHMTGRFPGLAEGVEVTISGASGPVAGLNGAHKVVSTWLVEDGKHSLTRLAKP